MHILHAVRFRSSVIAHTMYLACLRESLDDDGVL